MVVMRFNIVYAILMVSCYMLNLIKGYHGAVDYIFCYFRGIYIYSLVFWGGLAFVIGYFNVDFVKDIFT